MNRTRLQSTLLIALFPCSLFAAQHNVDFPKSGREQTSFGVSAALGFNEKKSELSGFYHFKQVQMHDHSFHADCEILFSGKFDGKSKISIFAIDATAKNRKMVKGILEYRGYTETFTNNPAEQIFSLVLSENLPSCSDAIEISNIGLDFAINKPGEWNIVSSIRSERAYFYNRPDEASKGKAYLVEGDIIYVYEERPDWYYVKYQNGRKETVGWIKKSDTIQFSEPR